MAEYTVGTRVKLNDTKLRSLRPRDKAYQVADGGGLFVEVLPSGVLSFRYQYRFQGVKQKIVLGKYPAISLSEARSRHREMVSALAHGRNPAQERREERETFVDTRRQSFEQFANHWFDQWAPGKSASNVAQAKRWFENDCFPIIGKLQVTAVKPSDVLAVVDRIKERGAVASARKVRQMLHTVFDHAIDRLLIETNPCTRIKPKSIGGLTARDRALSPQEIGRLVRGLQAEGGNPAPSLALRIILLTLVRKNELLTARWEDIDFANAEWVIPASRTKTRKAHWVPLAHQTVEALEQLKLLSRGEPYALPHNFRSGDHMSPTTLNEVVSRMKRLGTLDGIESFTVHDLRRTGATQLSEMGFRSELVERALNHEIPGVAGIYNRAEHRDARREMLQQWADTIDAWAAGATVTALRKSKTAAGAG